MGILSRLTGRQERDSAPQNANDVLLQALMNSEGITRQMAMTLPAVSGAVDFICNCVASMPVKLYKAKAGKVQEVEDNRVKLLNGDTGDTLDAFQMKKALVEDYLMGKGGYCYIDRVRNDVRSLRYVKDSDVNILTNCKPIFKNYIINVDGNQYKPYEFIKLLRNTKDGASGVGVTEEINKALETAYQTILFQLATVKTGGNKKGFLKSQRKLAQEEINALKNAWARMYSNNSENVVVLNNGLEFQEASNTALEMQLDQTKNTLRAEINDVFHIDLSNFDLTFKLAIYPILCAFQVALNRDLLLEKEKKHYYFEFDVKEIIKASVIERYQAYRTAKETGWMTYNEMRAAENMEHIEGLDVVNVGLGAVLYDVNEHTYYTPNTDTTGDPNDGVNGGEEKPEEQKPEEQIILPNVAAERSYNAVAVDYDKTLTKGGKIDPAAVEKIKQLKKTNRIILWTGRTGENLREAVEECKRLGLEFDEIAEGKPQVDAFIDDKALTIDSLRGNDE